MATIQNDLKLDWSVGLTTAEFFTAGRFLGAQPPYNIRSLAGRSWQEGIDVDTTKVEGDPPTTYTSVSTDIQTTAYGQQAICRFFAGDYYYRIWVVPPILTVQNPVLGFNYSFAIWNAYPAPNTLNTIGGSGQTGLTLDFDPPPEAYGNLEYREVFIAVDNTAPNEVHGYYTFTFTDGLGLFEFITVLARFVNVLPVPPVIEHWDFLTDIIVSRNAKEQRIALRENPRMSQGFVIPLDNEDDRRFQYTQWYKSLPADIIIPYPGYSTSMTQEAAAAATKLYFDPTRTNLRAGEFLIITDPVSFDAEIATIDTVDADGCTLVTGITKIRRAGTIVCPGLRSRLDDNTGPIMTPITGELQVNSAALAPRSLPRPGSTATFSTRDGYNILDRRPLAEAGVVEAMNAAYQVMDGKTGPMSIRASWPHPQISGVREYLIQRIFEPLELDYWRDFIQAAQGMREPFLVSTYREDLTKTAEPIGSQLIITNADYESQYFPFETYKRIHMQTTGSGDVYRTILSVVDNGDDTWTLELDTPMPGGFISVESISFLNLTRLGNDRVTVEHRAMVTRLKLTLKAIDA